MNKSADTCDNIHSVGYLTFYSFLITSVLLFLSNITTFLIVFINRKSTSCFLLNLFVTSIAAQLLGLLILMDQLNLIELSGKWSCGLMGVSKKMTTGSMPLSVSGLSYERLKTPGLRGGNFSLGKVFLTTWGVSLLLSSPAFFTVEEFVPDEGKPYCMQKPLFNNIIFKILYEAILCQLLHILPSIYMIYYLIKINFRAEYLVANEALPTPLKRKLHRVQLIFWYSVSFVVFWLPFGVINFVRKILEDPWRKVTFSIFRDTFQSIFYLMLMTFFFFCPIIHLWAHSRALFSDLLATCSRCYRKATKETAVEGPHIHCITSGGRLETMGEYSFKNYDGPWQFV